MFNPNLIKFFELPLHHESFIDLKVLQPSYNFRLELADVHSWKDLEDFYQGKDLKRCNHEVSGLEGIPSYGDNQRMYLVDGNYCLIYFDLSDIETIVQAEIERMCSDVNSVDHFGNGVGEEL